ncbi:MAG TPA: sigma-70 family RNA polymerase sigma factor [Bacteroidia bacterium]|jgi:RNA polymerase sigma-70 factor (ECF subfamily)
MYLSETISIRTALNAHHKTERELQEELQQVEAAKADPDKFAVLYDKYFRNIFVFVHRRTGDEELTADLTQHVFLKAMVNIKRYEYKGVPFSAWLFRIALNEINMYFRKSNKTRVVSLENESLAHIITEAKENDNEDNRKLLLGALSKLKEDEMMLVELRFFEGRPFAEIGVITGITENNAKVKMYRVLDKLKGMLKGKMGDG